MTQRSSMRTVLGNDRAGRPSPRPAVLSLRKKVVFAIAASVLFLALVEAVCRAFPHKDTPSWAGAGYVVPDADLLWRMAPLPYSNEFGFRDDPFNKHADVRILLLGDSVSWGDGIEDFRRCYPQLLERMLATEDAPTVYEVINSGVPGYSTFQEAAYLRLRGLAFRPNLIVLQFCLNDVVERYQALAAYGGNNVFLDIDTRKSVKGVYGFFLRNSRAFERLARFLQRRARNWQNYKVEKLAADSLPPELEEAWARTLSEIDDIHRTAVESNIPLLLVISPYEFQLHNPVGLRQPQDRLIKYIRSRNIPCVDLLPELARVAQTSSPLFNDENHLSEQGHWEVARLLVAPVRALLHRRVASPADAAAQPDRRL